VAFWARVREHKIIQWAVAYLGAALALAHGQELVGHAFHWPDIANRIFIVALIVGLPIALTLAWYHGHRGLTRISAGELTIISVLVLIGAVFFAAAIRPSDEHAPAAPADEPVAVATPPGGSAAGAAVPASNAASAGPQDRALPNSVAVLPFENLSPNADDAYFAAGIHAEVISQLNKLRNLNVTSRASVARYADTELSIPQVAAELGVGAVMGATVRYADNRVRIAAELIDAANDRPLWSDVYERDLADVFTIQADIAMSIANALEAEFSLAEQRTLEQAPTSSTAAYELYLQARSIVNSTAPESISAAHALLDRAIAVDPAFAGAYGMKAALYAAGFTNTVLGAGVAPEGRSELESRVREFTERALALDPDVASARGALRTLDALSWRWSSFERALRPEDEVDLSPPQLWSLSFAGKHAEAVRIGEKIAALSPNSAAAQVGLAVVHHYAGDRAASLRNLGTALELSPATPLTRAWLAYNAIARGSSADALPELRLTEQLLGDNRTIAFLPELAYAYSRIGRSDDARRLFEETRALGERGDIGAGSWALAYLAIGDEDEALRYLEALAEKARNHEPDQGYINVMNLKMNFLADPRLEEPRFAEVLSRIRGD
jgi:TolB-like protein